MSTVIAPPPAAPPRAPAKAEAPPEIDAFTILSAEIPRGHSSRFGMSLPSAIEALVANKGRAVLTTLGIIIGVAAVIVMVSIGQGASAQVSDRLAGLGTNVLTISPGSSTTGGVRGGAGSVQTLKEEDATAIGNEIPGLKGVSPIVQGNVQVIFGNLNWQTRVQGVRTDFFAIQNWQIADGSFFTNFDDGAARSVAVMGQTVANSVFPRGTNPIGQVIRVRNVPFTVVGLLASKGASGFQDQDDVLFIPFETGQIRLFGPSALNSISVQATDADKTEQVTADITELLRERHRLRATQNDDFSIRSSNDIIETAQGVSQTLTLLLSGVAAVSLIVGGIGIMNIMLVSVTERTREIGIRMAIGARPADVLSQFLVEAVVLSILGGLIGIAIGVGLALGIPKLAGWPTVLSYPAIGLSFGFAGLVGVFFGLYPAKKASELNPIDALRAD
jgi:putative ABC transport system permease protein